MAAAARVGDNHTCPIIIPGTGPHTGGPILPPGIANVLIGGQPAAVMGNQCVCAGPPDSISTGSGSVTIGGSPAARMGDSTVHGGSITVGFSSVDIGE